MLHIFKIYYLMNVFDKFNTKFWLASATDETKLWFSPSAKYIVAPKSLFWVRAMIGLLKNDIVDLPITLNEIQNTFPVIRWLRWGAYNKDFDAASQSIPSRIELRLLRGLNFGRPWNDVVLAVFYWSAIDIHSKREVLEILNE